MFTVMTVLRSGGIYDSVWVRKLRDAIARHITIPFQFRCLSDVPVSCESIPLEHNWPIWWAKMELFRPGVIIGPTLYIDLDTLILKDIAAFATIGAPFSMLRNLANPQVVGSGMMWFGAPMKSDIYDLFNSDPDYWMERFRGAGTHCGDQAFIYHTLGVEPLPRLQDLVPGLIAAFDPFWLLRPEMIPEKCAVVMFKGPMKPDLYSAPWIREAWK